MARKRDFLTTARNVIRSRFTKKLERVAREAFEETKEAFNQEFDSNNINQELEGHSSPSAILRSNGWQRRGSLFGFMGFNEGRDPVGQLRETLNSESRGLRFKLSKNIFKRAVGILGTLESPSADQLAQDGHTLDGWGDGRAWPEVLEDSGIENLSYFYANPPYGRSEEGTQVKAELNPGTSLKKMDYLSPLLKKAEKRFIKTLKERARQR